jgi:hypothetical protein
MSANVMLDIAIGLAMLYLLGALFCTIVQEWIASLFKLRAKNLKAAIGYLIDGKTGVPSAKAKEVLNHPLLRIADQASGKLLDKAPSYVATRNFTVSLVHALDLRITDGKINPAPCERRCPHFRLTWTTPRRRCSRCSIPRGTRARRCSPRWMPGTMPPWTVLPDGTSAAPRRSFS